MIEDILCEQYERTISPDLSACGYAQAGNCVSFEGKTLQIPRDEYRCNYIRVRARVHRYMDNHRPYFMGRGSLQSMTRTGIAGSRQKRRKK